METNFRLVIYNGNGYSFEEYTKPIIEDLLYENNYIYLLQADYNLTEKTMFMLNELLSSPNFQYKIVNILENYSDHKSLIRLIADLEQNEWNMLVLGSDFYPVDRYLINFARSKEADVLLLHSNIMSPSVLKKYREIQSVGESLITTSINTHVREKITKVLNKSGVFGLFLYVLNYCTQKVILVLIKTKKLFSSIKHNYIYPYILTKKIFRSNQFDKYKFTSGRGDIVLCYSPYEVAALKHAVPLIKNSQHIQFPASKYSSSSFSESRNLLLLLSCYWKELPENQLQFWIQTVNNISNKTLVDRVDLRFHPRTKTTLHWPKKIKDLIEQLGCKVCVVDGKKISLVQSAQEYIGFVGAVSGSLRTVRSVSSGFVIGLLNASGDTNQKEWMLGEIEGIHWLEEGEEIKKEYLMPFVKDETQETAAEVIQNLLIEKTSQNPPQPME